MKATRSIDPSRARESVAFADRDGIMPLVAAGWLVG